MPAEEALRDDNNEVVIAKSKKVVALTKSVFAAVVIILFFFSVGSVLLILENQERAADRILDCTTPTGACYQSKIADSQLRNAVMLLTIVEFCANKFPESVEQMTACVNKEVSTQ